MSLLFCSMGSQAPATSLFLMSLPRHCLAAICGSLQGWLAQAREEMLENGKVLLDFSFGCPLGLIEIQMLSPISMEVLFLGLQVSPQVTFSALSSLDRGGNNPSWWVVTTLLAWLLGFTLFVRRVLLKTVHLRPHPRVHCWWLGSMHSP